MRREDAKIFAVPLYCLNLLYCQAPAHDPLDLACSIWWRGFEPNARCGVRVRAAAYCMHPETTKLLTPSLLHTPLLSSVGTPERAHVGHVRLFGCSQLLRSVSPSLV